MNKWIQAALPMVLGAGLAATGIGAPLAAAMVGGGAALGRWMTPVAGMR